MVIFSRLQLKCLTSPKDTTEAKFIKYFNDKTVVFNNQIITGLLLLRTHSCKHLWAIVSSLNQISNFSSNSQMAIYLESLSSMEHFPCNHVKELELGHNCAKRQVKAWGGFFLQFFFYFFLSGNEMYMVASYCIKSNREMT